MSGTGEGIKVIGLRCPVEEFHETSEFIRKNRKHVLRAVPLMRLDFFSLVPFETYRSLFESIQLNRAEEVVRASSNVFNSCGKNLPDVFQSIVKWCSYMNSRKTDLHFSSATSDNKKDKIHFNWTHNLGITTKNFSTIQYNAFQDSKFSENWNIEINDLGIISMSLTFEKRSKSD